MSTRCWFILQEKFSGKSTIATLVQQDEKGDFVHSKKQPLEALCEKVGAINATVLVCAEDVFRYRQSILKTQKKFLYQALPFLVEERVIENIETQHIAYGPTYNDMIEVAVLDRALMDDMYQYFLTEKLILDEIYTELDGLPQSNSEIHLWQDGMRYLVCTSEGLRFSFPRGMFDLVIQKIEPENLEKVSLYASVSQEVEQEISKKLFATGLTYKPKIEKTSYFSRIITGLEENPNKVGFLQGGYKTQVPSLGNYKRWQPLFFVCLGWFFLQLLLNGVLAFWYDYKAGEYTAHIQKIFKTIHPNIAPKANIREQMFALINKNRKIVESSTFLEILNRIVNAPLIAEEANITFKSMSFARSSRELKIQLSAPSYERLNDYVNGLRKTKLNVSIGAESSSGDAISAVLTIFSKL